MSERIKLYEVIDLKQLIEVVYEELELISLRKPSQSAHTQDPLLSCCHTLFNAGACSVLAQRNVHDPDFMAEYSSYYSKQFSEVKRLCTRLHFFKQLAKGDNNPLTFIDNVKAENYLGFVTLRPVIMSPVGASILSLELSKGFIRSADEFPVHIMGKKLTVCGTPFMQQDNAVGACAQASIWMALRTLRKREGDRAHDPAQITDAATRYNVNGRIKPNRQGLTETQMIEAIRAAGYSPHSIHLGHWRTLNPPVMSPNDIENAFQKIHPYVESEIPVILLLSLKNSGHAVVAVGHTWTDNPKTFITKEVSNSVGLDIKFTHAVSWIPELIVNNDNSGPYLKLPATSTSYAIEHIAYAIPLLPPDVFMSGEEALAVGLTIVSNLYDGFFTHFTKPELEKSASDIAIRILLVEKRKLRRWAADTPMVQDLKDELRLMNLPKRVWVLELHLKSLYGAHGANSAKTLVGFVLIDPTGDNVTNSVLMLYQNKNFPLNIPFGSMVLFDNNTGLPTKVTKTDDPEPLLPLRT